MQDMNILTISQYRNSWLIYNPFTRSIPSDSPLLLHIRSIIYDSWLNINLVQVKCKHMEYTVSFAAPSSEPLHSSTFQVGL